MMPDNSTTKTFKVPNEMLPRCYVAREDMRSAMNELKAMEKRYAEEVQRLGAKVQAAKVSAITEVCKALGIEYDHEKHAYMLEMSYLEHGAAYLLEITPEQPPALEIEVSEAGPGALMQAPAKNKLN